MSRKKRKKQKRNRISDDVKIARSRDSLRELKGRRFTRIEAYPPNVIIGKPNKPNDIAKESLDYQTKKAVHSILGVLFVGLVFNVLSANRDETANPPKNAELLLSLFLRRDEQDAVIGDLIDRRLHQRLGRRRADLYAYGEVCRSLYPFIKRLLFDTGLIVLLGQWIRKLIA